MKRVLFICEDPPHPIHKKFAKSINSDFYYFKSKNKLDLLKKLKKIPKNYDIYITEGLFNYRFLIKLFINKNSKIINLFSDPRLFQIISGKKFDFKHRKVKKYSKSRINFAKNAIKKLDGAICIGNYQAELIKKIAPNLRLIVVPPMIERKIFFQEETSSLRKENIFFLGNGPDYHYKGLDFLIKIFRELNKKFPKSKLYIIGSEWDNFKKKIKNENIFFIGSKGEKEIITIMNDCSLCCHFGRGEATGISILEAMSKGIPCIVSEETGAKEYIRKVDERFVKKFSEQKEIIKLIEKYFKASIKKRRHLGAKFRREAIKFSEVYAIKKFRKEFKKF